jgi:hypothetical protein
VEIHCASLASLKDDWIKLYKSNPYLFPYSSYEFALIYNKSFYLSINRIWMQRLFYVIKNDNGYVHMIIPLLKKGNHYYIFGDFCATGYLDFIYPHNAEETLFQQAFETLKKEIGNGVLHLRKINSKSKMCSYLTKQYKCLGKSICVNISLPSSYEEYWNSLGKSIRQNIRTSYNRMRRENKRFETVIYINEQVDEETQKNMMEIYHKRAEQRSGKRPHWLTRYIQLHYNPVTLSTFSGTDNLNAYMKIDGKMVGFLSGYISNDGKTAVIPRHAIDSEYGVYSIGAVLITEVIAYLLKNTNVRNFDLSRGNEKYKYSLGGQEHYNYSFDI